MRAELGPRYGGVNGDQVVVLCGLHAGYRVGGFYSCSSCIAALVDFVTDLRGVDKVSVSRATR